MADQKLTALSALSALAGGVELVYIVADPGGTPVSHKITLEALLELAGVPVALVWDGDSYEPSGFLASNRPKIFIGPLDEAPEDNGATLHYGDFHYPIEEA